MTPNRTHQSYLAVALCTALLGLGSVALPTAALAAENDRPDPAPLGQVVPQSPTTPQSAIVPSNPASEGSAALASGSSSASGDWRRASAWCDPITNSCDRHPWLNSVQGE